MDPTDHPFDERAGRALSGLLFTMDSRRHYASYSEAAVGPGHDSTIYVAADIGLIQARLHWDFADDPLGYVGIDAEVCPWVDVINPELTARSVASPDSNLAEIELRLLIQLPRIDLTRSGPGTTTSQVYQLGRFAAAILRQCRRHAPDGEALDHS